MGVPDATSFWQVGDSSQQNGLLKTLWYCTKREYVRWKSERGLPFNIGPHEILPLVNELWEASFCNQENNCKAVSDCGWNPCNRKLLTHSDLENNVTSTETQEQVTETSSSTMDVL